MPDDLSGLDSEFRQRLREANDERTKQMNQIRADLQEHLNIPPNTELSRRIALFLTANWQLK